MIAHILYYFSDQGDLVLDPMAGGGVVADPWNLKLKPAKLKGGPLDFADEPY
jgi:hypothetical protein